MGILNLFKSKSENISRPEIPWHRLTSLEQLETIIEESKTKPVAIFKHSTRCGTSSMALRQFERNYNIPSNQIKLYFLDLVSFREVSNEVGITFQVLHESPQLIVIKNGSSVYHASHYRIDASILEKFV